MLAGGHVTKTIRKGIIDPGPITGQPELLVFGMIAALLAAGAYDAWATPIVMKKGRPAHTVAALCDDATFDAVRAALVSETGTLGVRAGTVQRWPQQRVEVVVDVDGAHLDADELLMTIGFVRASGVLPIAHLDRDRDASELLRFERDPVDPKSGYTRQVVWYDQEHYRVLKVDYYDRKDEGERPQNIEHFDHPVNSTWVHIWHML